VGATFSFWFGLVRLRSGRLIPLLGHMLPNVEHFNAYHVSRGIIVQHDARGDFRRTDGFRPLRGKPNKHRIGFGVIACAYHRLAFLSG
jgi:hypothetical protein